MFIEVPDLLSPAQVQRLRDIAASAKFVDGRISNPNNKAKNNLQLDHTDASYKESAQIMGEALVQNESVQDFTFMLRIAPPLMCRYKPDMAYGVHSDNAFVNVGQGILRSDISCTMFISDPETYEGGELTIHLGNRSIAIKGSPGSAVLYPSTTLHEVKPVITGERLVAITFMESQIMDEQKRHLLYQLNEVAAIEGYNISWDNRVMLQHISASLHRMWST
jgi:PKHD-type hydroxylase